MSKPASSASAPIFKSSGRRNCSCASMNASMPRCSGAVAFFPVSDFAATSDLAVEADKLEAASSPPAESSASRRPMLAASSMDCDMHKLLPVGESGPHVSCRRRHGYAKRAGSREGGVMKTVSAMAMVGWLLIANLAAAEGRQCRGVEFPEHMQVAGSDLMLNGLGMCKATFLKVNVYVGALYVPALSHDANALIESAGPQELILRFVRSVGV